MQPLVVPGVLDSLAKVREYVEGAAASAGLSKGASYNLVLAIDELATNSVIHGYEEHGLSGDLKLSAEIDDAELVVTLEDTGPEYDPRGQDLPGAEDLAKPLEDRAIGGLGIFLVLNGVDRFDYRRDGDKNLNILVMKRGKTGSK